MSKGEVILTARFTAKEGKEEELRAKLESLVKPTRSEEGCVFYYLHQVKGQQGRFLFYECFRDQDAFDIHSNSPYIKGFFAESDRMVEGDPEITFLERIR